MALVWSIIGFIVVMGLVVTIHEWGHYQVARWFNVKVKVFSIGFGKSLYEKQGEETTFKIGIIPLGGYVRFLDEMEGPVSVHERDRAFNHQSVYKRFAVVAAGPIINLVFAWLVFSVMYMIGISGIKPVFTEIAPDSPIAQVLPHAFFDVSGEWQVIQVNGDTVDSWKQVHQKLLQARVHHQNRVTILVKHYATGAKQWLKDVRIDSLDLNQLEQNWLQELGFKPFQFSFPPVLGSVQKESAADHAGLQPNDQIVAVNGIDVQSWPDLVAQIQSRPDQTVLVHYLRDNALHSVSVILGHKVLNTGQRVGQMGIGVYVDPKWLEPYTSIIQYHPVEAFKQGFQQSIDVLKMTLVMLQRMIFGDVSLQHLSGPISIAQFSGQALQSGWVTFLGLLGLISLSIGILNLLPIPILDGGHLVYYLIEMVKGSPVSTHVLEAGQRIGIVLILGVTFIALFNDILRISNG